MVDSKIIYNFFEFLNKNEFKYVLIKNDDNTIPNNIESDNDIDFLIYPDDYYRLIETAESCGYEKIVGESCKKYFLEQLREDILLRKEDCYFHFYDRLSCTPLTNMGDCKMPLEKSIQQYIWKNRVWDSDNNWWIMDDISILLYLIVRSVFDKKMFKDKYIREIEKRSELIKDNDFYTISKPVFFGFTLKMIELVQNKQYERVLKEYLSFVEY